MVRLPPWGYNACLIETAPPDYEVPGTPRPHAQLWSRNDGGLLAMLPLGG